MIQIKETGSKSPVSNYSSNSSTENGDSNEKSSCQEGSSPLSLKNHLLPTSQRRHTSHPYAAEYLPSRSYWQLKITRLATYKSQETAKRENEESSSPKRQNGRSDYINSCSSPTSSTRQYCDTLTSEKPNTAPTTPVPKPLSIPVKARRADFSEKEVAELEREFCLDIYCSASRKIEIANRLGLPEIRIKCWFQNRRSKLKRCHMELEREFRFDTQLTKLRAMFIAYRLGIDQIQVIKWFTDRTNQMLENIRNTAHPYISYPHTAGFSPFGWY